jgi:DNA-binding XRE family transcriptional regulator
MRLLLSLLCIIHLIILAVRKGDEKIMIFSERLKQEREKRNWSQNDLAEKIHVSRQSVSKWETGKNYPSIEVII